jgi:subtilisin family serine protease
VKCIDWAVANGAHVLSNSWAGPGLPQELVEAVTRAEKKGVLFVAAAGNTASVGNDNDAAPNYPASLPQANVISVGAIDVNNSRGSFSHYGRKSVDIGAPGVGIVSTVRNNQYAKLDGTSMAAPHVAGAAVLVWAKTFSSPAQDPNQMATVRDLIYAHARPVPALRDFWGQSAPARVPGGVLDISFLGQAPPSDETPPPQTPTSQPESTQITAVGHARFASGQISATESRTIASARIVLKQPSLVQIVANSNVSSIGGASRFATGFSDKEAMDQYWLDSIRNPELKPDGGWVNMGSNFTIQLPAGDHTVHWKVWMDRGASLKFSSGLMLLQASPVAAAAGDAAIRPVSNIEARMKVKPEQLDQEFR